MAYIEIEQTSPLPGGAVLVRRWSFEVVVRGNPFAILRFVLYEEGSKATPRHRNVKMTTRTAHGRHFPGGFARGMAEEKVAAWWDALSAHNFSRPLFDLRGARGPVEAPVLPEDIRARALAAFEVKVEVPDAV